jgi:transposase
MAEKLLRSDQIGISDTTINRLIRSFPEKENRLVRVLSFDDWAKRKGQQYGTLFVDLEPCQIADVLPDRMADTLANWLKKHSGIEIVSRDRSQTYAEAIDRGAAKAIQIADRWHLLKNTSDLVDKVLQ